MAAFNSSSILRHHHPNDSIEFASGELPGRLNPFPNWDFSSFGLRIFLGFVVWDLGFSNALLLHPLDLVPDHFHDPMFHHKTCSTETPKIVATLSAGHSFLYITIKDLKFLRIDPLLYLRPRSLK